MQLKLNDKTIKKELAKRKKELQAIKKNMIEPLCFYKFYDLLRQYNVSYIDYFTPKSHGGCCYVLDGSKFQKKLIQELEKNYMGKVGFTYGYYRYNPSKKDVIIKIYNKSYLKKEFEKTIYCNELCTL